MRKIVDWYLKIPVFIRNKYTLLSAIFIVWMVFFDSHNYINQQALKKEFNELTTKKEYFENEINQINSDKEALFHDSILLEKFAREKYFMKKPNEDVFVIDVDTIH